MHSAIRGAPSCRSRAITLAVKTRTSQAVEVLTRREKQPFVASWYELAHDSHPWFRWRLAAVLRQLRSLNIPLYRNLRVLEVGSGTGVLRSQFEANTNWIVDGADLDYSALYQAAPARGRTLYYDILDEVAELAEAYDVLILYDVLEHICEPTPFIASLLRHLKPGGLLLINVPAVRGLFNDFDKVVGHFRRYDHRTLVEEFRGFHVEIIDLRYWGLCLLPLLVFRDLMLRIKRNQSPDEIVRRGFESPHRLFDKFLSLLMRAELALLRRPPVGSSLLMVCRKGESPSR